MDLRIAVVSGEPCFRSPTSPSGYATDGGFPLQMRAPSDLFAPTTLVVPCVKAKDANGLLPLSGCTGGRGDRCLAGSRVPGSRRAVDDGIP